MKEITDTLDSIKIFGSANSNVKRIRRQSTELEKIFNITTACISPNQAGLSVLKSMGNRTIFITKKSAITGGEIFNIENNVNGLLYEKDEDLIDILIWLLDNPQKNMEMNINAYKFYHEYRTPKMMSNSICQAIENSLQL